MKIGNISIGINHDPFIIAEMSGNYNQSIERAFEIIDAASDSGDGAPPYFYNDFLGTKAKKYFKKVAPIKIKDIF